MPGFPLLFAVRVQEIHAESKSEINFDSPISWV